MASGSDSPQQQEEGCPQMPTRKLPPPSSTDLARQSQMLRECARNLVQDSRQIREESAAVLRQVRAALTWIQQGFPIPVTVPELLADAGWSARGASIDLV